jgi:hypothetical protein
VREARAGNAEPRHCQQQDDVEGESGRQHRGKHLHLKSHGHHRRPERASAEEQKDGAHLNDEWSDGALELRTRHQRYD